MCPISFVCQPPCAHNMTRLKAGYVYYWETFDKVESSEGTMTGVTAFDPLDEMKLAGQLGINALDNVWRIFPDI